MTPAPYDLDNKSSPEEDPPEEAIAFHEAGHAVAAIYNILRRFPPNDCLKRFTIGKQRINVGNLSDFGRQLWGMSLPIER